MNLNLVFSKSMNLNLKIKNKMNGSNQCRHYGGKGGWGGAGRRTPLMAASAIILVH